MKKKIITICLVVALALTAIGGATLAYFTDNEQRTNVFSVGKVDISLEEVAGIISDGERLPVKTENNTTTYTNVTPSQYLVKTPVIKNKSLVSDAYVRVAVTMNKKVEINDAIDNFYEGIVDEDGNRVYSDEDIQGIYDNVFDDWGISYIKTDSEPIRLWNDKPTGVVVEGVELIDVDYATAIYDLTECFSPNNMFKSEAEENCTTGKLTESLYTEAGQSYYHKALEAAGYDCRVYVFYLKLDAGKSYTLFNGINVPAKFNNDQMDMFDGLTIGVYADAIQTVGFDSAREAFEALQDEHPLGWWK